MTAANKQASRYDPAFANELYAIENGEYMKQCMQCGLCVVTCPARHLMDLQPRKYFKAIQAGDRDQVLKANTPWLCTSCNLCTVRCPRGIPIIDVMHGMKLYLAQKQGIKVAPGALFSKTFFDVMLKRGRQWEAWLTQMYYLKAGPGAIKDAMKMIDVAQAMVFKKRLPLAPAKTIKGKSQLKKIYEKAAALAKEGH
ncbi:MAG: 4Fe-4S dicluster domain-containing protein [Candidatus Desulforudis sp.]|nr:4Fe-4S dicluster domain-containing protein [Desulforudis sp.]